MAQAKGQTPNKNYKGVTVGFEPQLWQSADALRGRMHAVLAQSPLTIPVTDRECMCNDKRWQHFMPPTISN